MSNWPQYVTLGWMLFRFVIMIGKDMDEPTAGEIWRGLVGTVFATVVPMWVLDMGATVTYYELVQRIQGPGMLYGYNAGTRMTKEEWLATDAGFKEEDFSGFGPWFRKREDRVPDIAICADVVCDLLDLPAPCSRNAMAKLEHQLRQGEADAKDVSIAYGLRRAADYLKEYIERAPCTTREYVTERIRVAFANLEKR